MGNPSKDLHNRMQREGEVVTRKFLYAAKVRAKRRRDDPFLFSLSLSIILKKTHY